MKKNNIILLSGLTVLAVVVVFSIVMFCNRNPQNSDPSNIESTTTTNDSALTDDIGNVKILNCNPDLQEVYTKLAGDFEKETGIHADIVTVAAGTCEETLGELLRQDGAPTVFCLHSQGAANRFREYLYDLTGSQVAEQLCSPKFALNMDGGMLAIPTKIEGFGLIYNASLLARSGYTRSDIQDFSTLQAVSQYITEHQSFATFSPPDFTDPAHDGLACLLTGTLQDEKHLKSFWDLYIANAPNKGIALDTFLEEKSVFYVGSTSDYQDVAGIGSNNLDILPAYYDGGGSLQCMSEHYLAVNARASHSDIQASLQFLFWLVTKTENSPAPIDQLKMLTPFKDAVYASNALEKLLRKYINDPNELKNITVSWKPCSVTSDQFLQTLSVALDDYTRTPDDAHWEAVAALLNGAVLPTYNKSRTAVGSPGSSYLGNVMVSTIWLSVSRRSETAGMPDI